LRAAKACVFGLIHDAHAAAYALNDAVMRDDLANERVGLRHRARHLRWCQKAKSTTPLSLHLESVWSTAKFPIK
jgi:hypothetical protein